MEMIDRNLEAIILYGAFDGNRPAHRAVKDKEQEMTNAGTDVYDRRTRIRRTTHFRLSSWAVRRAGKGQSVM